MMSTVKEVTNFIERFSNYLEQERTEHLETFQEQGCHLEGWFKGELLWFLTKEKGGDGLVDEFDREVRSVQASSGPTIDLKVHFKPHKFSAWLELKHVLVGEQKGTRFTGSYYFNKGSSSGFLKDIKKLQSLEQGDRYLVPLMTGNPGEEEWNKGLEKLSKNLPEIETSSLTNPANFPPYFFIGLIKV